MHEHHAVDDKGVIKSEAIGRNWRAVRERCGSGKFMWWTVTLFIGETLTEVCLSRSADISSKVFDAYIDHAREETR